VRSLAAKCLESAAPGAGVAQRLLAKPREGLPRELRDLVLDRLVLDDVPFVDWLDWLADATHDGGPNPQRA